MTAEPKPVCIPVQMNGRLLADLKARARRGEQAAIRLLHFGYAAPPPRDWPACITAAPAGAPPPPPAFGRQNRGGIDFHRLHCLALDRLPELLATVLPIGTEGATEAGAWAWWGHHEDRPEVVAVCLLGGSWVEPNTGKSGRDLISLLAHLFAISNGRAAHFLAEWLGVGVRAYA